MTDHQGISACYGEEMSIASSPIEDAVDGSAERRDELWRPSEPSARLHGEVLGRLVEVLAKTGALSAPDVQHILGTSL